MNWIVLLVSLGLAALWVVSMVVGAAPPWITWLVLIAAIILFATALAGLGYTKRRLGKPV